MTTKVDIKYQRKSSADEIKRLIASKYPIVWIESWEEDRVETALRKVAQNGFKQGLDFQSWTETNGFGDGVKVPLETALKQFMDEKKAGILLLKGFTWDLAPISIMKRLLMDIFQACKGSFKTVFLLSPMSSVPEDMSKEIVTMDFNLPASNELEEIFNTIMKGHPKTKFALNDEQKARLFQGALGLTSDEAKFAFQRMLVGKSEVNEESLKTIYEEKSRIIKRDGLLEYVPNKFSVDDVGGMENLKSWVSERAEFFSEEAKNAGLKMPKGILLTGVSGCGKSLCSQVIASAWGLPLYRLDMNRIYGGAIANAEESFRRAINQMEEVAPAILWLEEIEKGVAGYEQGDKGITARIFSSFLTWMQEHTTPVFVAATANEINRLPPELIRKGRFDEIFFVDLPKEAERQKIFEVHLNKRNMKMDDFNLNELAKATKDFNGAEIEQCVVNGLTYAFQDGKRPITQQDVFRAASLLVPLATTMAEQIKDIKRWADTRAVKASK